MSPLIALMKDQVSLWLLAPPIRLLDRGLKNIRCRNVCARKWQGGRDVEFVRFSNTCLKYKNVVFIYNRKRGPSAVTYMSKVA